MQANILVRRTVYKSKIKIYKFKERITWGNEIGQLMLISIIIKNELGLYII